MVGDRFFSSDVVANALVGTLAISARLMKSVKWITDFINAQIVFMTSEHISYHQSNRTLN